MKRDRLGPWCEPRIWMGVAAVMILATPSVHAATPGPTPPVAPSRCSCPPPPAAVESMEASGAVFTGIAIDRTLSMICDGAHRPADEVTVTFLTTELWKGDLADTVRVHTRASEDSCGYEFSIGTRYLVYATGDRDRLETGLCTRTQPRDRAAADLSALPPPKRVFAAASSADLSVDHHLTQLRSTSKDAARAATLALGDLGTALREEGVPSLGNQLLDTDLSKRMAAAEALGRLGDFAAGAAVRLGVALNDQERCVRTAALEALTRLGPAARLASPALAQSVAQDADRDLRIGSARALAAIGADAHGAVSPLLDALPSQDEELDREIVIALGRIHARPTETLPELQALAGDGGGELRATALSAIGNFGAEAAPALDTLLEGLKSDDASVRAAAAEAIGSLGLAAEKALPALAREALHPDAIVRIAAVGALGKLSESLPQALNHLGPALVHDDGGTRGSALRYFRASSPPAHALPPLIECMKDADPLAARPCIDLFRTLYESHDHLFPTLDEAAAETLRKMGRDAGGLIPALERALFEQDDATLQGSALRALGWLGVEFPAAMDVLARGVSHPLPGTRRMTVDILVQIRPYSTKPMVAALTTALASQDAMVRADAARTLAMLGRDAAAAVPMLREVSESDPEEQIQAAARDALGAIDSR